MLLRALRGKEAHYDKDHLQVAITLSNLSNVHGFFVQPVAEKGALGISRTFRLSHLSQTTPAPRTRLRHLSATTPFSRHNMQHPPVTLLRLMTDNWSACLTRRTDRVCARLVGALSGPSGWKLLSSHRIRNSVFPPLSLGLVVLNLPAWASNTPQVWASLTHAGRWNVTRRLAPFLPRTLRKLPVALTSWDGCRVRRVSTHCEFRGRDSVIVFLMSL